MADQLYLSYRIRGYSDTTMLKHFETMLNTFPFSKLATGQYTLKITAISWTEPPVFETPMNAPFEVPEVLRMAKEFRTADCAVQLEAFWDLWQFSETAGDWELAPARVSLMCFGPDFEDEREDHMRIDFGVDANFLPQPDLPDSIRMVQSNIRSLLHLTAELDNALRVESRRLWTESGESFVGRLMGALPPLN